MKDITKQQSFLFLAIGAVLLAYSILAIIDFTRSARAVIIMGSEMQPSSVVPDRIIATLFLLLLFTAGTALIAASVTGMIKSYKKRKESL